MKSVLKDESFSFYDWLTHKEYQDQEAEFLLLTQEEYQLRLQNGWQTPFTEVFSDEDYIIFAQGLEKTP